MTRKNRTRRRLRILTNAAGLTMVELLIAAFALGAVSIAALSFYQSQHSQYLQQNDVVDMQQNLRVVMVELTRQIRQAGYMAPGSVPAEVLGSNDDMLLLRFHDGDSVRAQVFFVVTDSLGTSNLMTQLNGEAPQVFAEGIDSVRFAAGGAGANIDWVNVSLVARSGGEGFRTAATTPQPHLFRRLNSTVKLRNG